MPKRVKVLDMFSGAGGFSLGFCWAFEEEKTDYEIFGLELDMCACRTYHYNLSRMFPGRTHVIRCDVRLPPLRLDEGLFDVIIGGPPCQPWSRATPKSKRGWKHPLADLTLYFFVYVIIYKPKVFVMEQVPSILDFPEWRYFFDRLSGQTTMDEFFAPEVRNNA